MLGVDYSYSGALKYGVDYSYWFDDGYEDYIRNFMWAMGAIPEFAPRGQNHLLHSSSVIRDVQYSGHRISYRTFAREGTGVLRSNFKPTCVTAGGEALDERQDLRQAGCTVHPLAGGDCVVRVRHVNSGDVTINRE